jgi:membrane-bound lytic murein transglycosylase B
VTVGRRRVLGWLAATSLPIRAAEPPALLRADMADFARQTAERRGIDIDWITEVLLDARLQFGVLRAMAAPGTARPWRVFRRDYVHRTRVDGGVRFWRENAALLASVSARFGVPEEVVVAIIGVETVYGRQTGSFRVLDALVTLGFEGQNRAPYFQTELEEFLQLARDGVVDPFKARGSYAGAMGWPQFMPSSLRRWGNDFDGDGRIDLWTSIPDITGSVGNYFRSFGWQTGGDVVLPFHVTDVAAADALVAMGVEPQIPPERLAMTGVVEGRALRADERAALLRYEGESGLEYWLGLPNFRVITRYNRSQNYALAVWQLSQAIGSAYRAG